MRKKNKARKKRKSAHELLEELFPKEIVHEVDATISDLDIPRRSNPPQKGRPPKPWGRKWSEERKKLESE